jgi:acetylornithine/succinyldiaminopimelate/putrescine aminotransferase
LLPGIDHLQYNSFPDLDRITENTACVIAETVQAEAGIRPPQKEWLQALEKRCTESGALFILDEIQAGFGRTGKLWGFEQFGVVPHILLLGKALGGGLPMGAFIAGKELMDHLADNPVLGHITTFGGHPLCCAAGKAAFEVLLAENLTGSIAQKEKILIGHLRHPKIKSVHTCGLWAAVEFANFAQCKNVIDTCIENGVITDWFLFAANCLRISPPLTITHEQLEEACRVILAAIK